MKIAATFLLLTVLASSAYGFQMKAMQMREDYGVEPLSDCYLNYYYYIYCTTSSWFWMQTDWTWGDIVGEYFTVGDPSMGASAGCPPYASCDPMSDQTISQFRVLDFAGYGTAYPGFFTVRFGIWCANEYGCPVGTALWSSGDTELCNAGWNYVTVSPPVCLTQCHTQPGPPYGYPRFLITAQMVGYTSHPDFPAFGLDNISTPLGLGCVMHDNGCCPALYPRPTNSHYSTMHSGYYGTNAFTYCPPRPFLDGGDTTGGSTYGCVELAWRVYLVTSGPTAVEPSTWGSIKSIYR